DQIRRWILSEIGHWIRKWRAAQVDLPAHPGARLNCDVKRMRPSRERRDGLIHQILRRLFRARYHVCCKVDRERITRLDRDVNFGCSVVNQMNLADFAERIERAQQRGWRRRWWWWWTRTQIHVVS